MIEIAQGHWIQPCKVTAVKSAGDDKCVVWVDGLSALEGFLVERDAEDVVSEIEDALDDEED